VVLDKCHFAWFDAYDGALLLPRAICAFFALWFSSVFNWFVISKSQIFNTGQSPVHGIPALAGFAFACFINGNASLLQRAAAAHNRAFDQISHTRTERVAHNCRWKHP